MVSNFTWRRALRPFFIVCVCVLFSELAFFSLKALGAAQVVCIEIPASAPVEGSAFTLGDIARISAPDKVRRVLSSLILSMEEENVVTREQVIRAVETSGLEGVRLEIRMPEKVRLEMGGADTSAGNGERTEFSPDESLSSVIKSLAAWEGEVEVSPTGPVPKGRLVSPAGLVPGTSAATLRFRDDAGRERSLGVRLLWTQNVLIMARSVPKGQSLRDSDFMTRSMRITRPGVYATRISEVVGCVSRKPLSQGEPVPLELLSQSPVAKKGKTVLIVVRRGGLMATVKGVLLDEGPVGGVVRVRRADNKKVVLRARVLDGDTVEVDVP